MAELEPDYDVVDKAVTLLLMECDAYTRRATAKRIAERFGFDVRERGASNDDIAAAAAELGIEV